MITKEQTMTKEQIISNLNKTGTAKTYYVQDIDVEYYY